MQQHHAKETQLWTFGSGRAGRGASEDPGSRLPPGAPEPPRAAPSLASADPDPAAVLARGSLFTHFAEDPGPPADVKGNGPAPRTPGEAMTEARHQIAELHDQAGSKKDEVKAEQVAEAQRIGAAGVESSQASVSRAEAEHRRAEADAKHAQSEAKTQGAAKTQEAHATIGSLKQELEQSVARDTEKVKQALAQERAAVRSQLEQQKQTLRTEAEKQRQNQSHQLEQKRKELETQARSRAEGAKKQIDAQQADLAGPAAEEKKRLRETSRAEAKRVDDAAKESARSVEAKGDADARTVEKQAETDAAHARSEGQTKASQLRAQSDQKKDGVLDTVKGWLSADPGASVIQAGEQRAQDLVMRGKMSGEALRTKAKASADDIRQEGQKQSLAITTRADTSSQQIDKRVADAKGQAEKAAEGRNKAIEDEQKKSMAALKAELDRSRPGVEAKLAEGLASIDKQLAIADQKLVADAEKRLADIKVKADATRRKLASGADKDVKKLEQMVHKTCADLDHAAAKAARDLHVTTKRAELETKKIVGARLAAIDKLAAKALSQIDGWVRRQTTVIVQAAQRLEQHIAGLGKQAKSANANAASQEALDSLKKAADAALPGLKKKEEDANSSLATELGRQQQKVEDLSQGKKDEELEKAKSAIAAIENSEHGFRTDSKAIIRDLKNLPPEEREALRQAYKAKTGEDLDKHLGRDLSPAEMKLLKAEWSHDPVAIAEAKLECAKGPGPDLAKLGSIVGAIVGGPVGADLGKQLGHTAQTHVTDKDAVKATLSDPNLTEDQRKQLAKLYEKETGQKLDNYLKENLAGKDLKEAQALAPKLPKPEDLQPPPSAEQMKQQEKAAQAIRQAMDGFHTNSDKLLEAMKGKDPAEIAALKAAYKDHFHVDLDDELEKHLSGTALKEAKAHLSGDPVDAAVAQLQEAQDHWYKTDSKKIQDVLEGIKDPEQRAKVAAAYEKQTGQKLANMLDSQMTGSDKDMAKALLEGDEQKAAGIKMDQAVNGGFVTNASDWLADKAGLPRDTVRGAVGSAVGLTPVGVAAQLATGGTGALGTTGFGADDQAVNKLLESCKSPAERQALLEAYRARTGRDLKTDLSQKMNTGIASLDGTGKLKGDIAAALLEGDTATASAGKMELSTKGLGKDVVANYVASQTFGLVDVRKDLNDQKAIFAELEGKSPEERKAILEAYAAKYGHGDAKAFDAFLKGNLGGMDLDKAQLLAKDGKVPPEFAVEYAMDAWRTDNAALKTALHGKSKEEIAAIRAAYNERFKPKTFDEEIDKNTHGRSNFETKLALEGEPTTPQEKIDRMKKIHDYERGAGGENKILRAVTGGSGFHNVSNFVTDLSSDSGKDLDEQYRRVLQLEAELAARGGKLDDKQQAELDKYLRYGNQDKESYEAAKDSVTTALAAAATVVVGTAVSILTAGAAAPAVIAAVAAIVGGAAGIGVKMVMKGDAYGNDELLVDAGMTVVNALTAGTLKMEALTALAKASPAAFAAVSGAIGGALSSGAQSVMTDTEAHNLLQALAHAGKAAGHGATSGAVSGLVGHGVNEGIGHTGTLSGSAIKGFISGSVSGVAGAMMDPAVLEGRWDDIAIRLAGIALQSGGQAAGDAIGDFRAAAFQAASEAAKAAQKNKQPLAEQQRIFRETLENNLAHQPDAHAKAAHDEPKSSGTAPHEPGPSRGATEHDGQARAGFEHEPPIKGDRIINVGPATETETKLNVAEGSKHRTAPTTEEIDGVRAHIEKRAEVLPEFARPPIGADPAQDTHYDPHSGKINLGRDLAPAKDLARVPPELHANASLSPKAAGSHEFEHHVGVIADEHGQKRFDHTDPVEAAIGNRVEEAQASYRAALHDQHLSIEERMQLIRDGNQRLRAVDDELYIWADPPKVAIDGAALPPATGETGGPASGPAAGRSDPEPARRAGQQGAPAADPQEEEGRARGGGIGHAGGVQGTARGTEALRAGNRDIDRVCATLGLTLEQRRLLHEEVHLSNFGYEKMLEHARAMFPEAAAAHDTATPVEPPPPPGALDPTSDEFDPMAIPPPARRDRRGRR